MSFLIALAAGGLTTLSPCVLPILPVILGSAAHRDRFAPWMILAGLVASFTTVGWSLAAFGSFLPFEGDHLRSLGGALLGILGLGLLAPAVSTGFSRLLGPVGAWADRTAGRFEGKGRAGLVMTGALLGVIWAPCSGPTLGAAVALAVREGGGLASFLLMAVFALGAALPLLLIALGGGRLLRARQERVLLLSTRLKRIFGLGLMMVSLLVLTGMDKRLEAALVERMPEIWIDLTTRF